MCEFLVSIADGYSVRDAGDIVSVLGDGADWGLECDLRLWVAAGLDPAEFPTNYGIVSVPGYPVDLNLAAALEVDGLDRPRHHAKSLWAVDMAKVPTLTADRYVSLSFGQARLAVVRKGDGMELPVRPVGGQNKRRYATTVKRMTMAEAAKVRSTEDVKLGRPKPERMR